MVSLNERSFNEEVISKELAHYKNILQKQLLLVNIGYNEEPNVQPHKKALFLSGVSLY